MIIRETQRGRYTRWHAVADDLMDVEAWLESTPRTWRQRYSAHTGEGRTWDAGANYETTRRYMRTGWEEGVKKMHDLLSTMTVPNEHVSKWQHDVAGYLPDVPRYLADAPDHMLRKGKVSAKRPIVKLAINGRISAAINANEQINFGCAMAALVDRIEQSGKRVELTMEFNTNNSNNSRRRWCMSWVAKRAEDHVDLAALAFSLGHPCAFRRVAFALMERSPRDWEDSMYGIDGGMYPEDALEMDDKVLRIQGISHNPRACATLAGASVFAAQMINDAAGETLVEPLLAA